jgi:hypothetical protein
VRRPQKLDLNPVIGITTSRAKHSTSTRHQHERPDLFTFRCWAGSLHHVAQHSDASGRVPRVLLESGPFLRVSEFGPANKNRWHVRTVHQWAKSGQVAAHVCCHKEPGKGHCEHGQNRYGRNFTNSSAPAEVGTTADRKCSRAHAVIVRDARVFRIVLSVKGRISSWQTIFRW